MSTYENPSMEEMLEHHGIIGMKWGVRRYQNDDGTLTNAGKARYRDQVKEKLKEKLKEKVDEERNKGMHDVRMKTDPLYRQKHTKQPWNEQPSKGQAWDEKPTRKSVHDDHTKAHDKKKASEMSDKELRDRLNRLDMERRYNQLNPGTVSKGKDYLNKAIKVGTTVATVTTTALTVYNNYNKIAEILNKRKG